MGRRSRLLLSAVLIAALTVFLQLTHSPLQANFQNNKASFSSSNNGEPKGFYDNYYWDELPELQRKAALIMGYNKEMWDGNKASPAEALEWDKLPQRQQLAALSLGYKKELWNNNHHLVNTDNRSLVDGDDNSLWPRLVWLMTFPNSGTTFTQRAVHSASNYSVATNYAHEVTLPDAYPVPIYAHRAEGPFRKDFADFTALPPTYVLVKTHCMRYFGRQRLKPIRRTAIQFLNHCRSTTTFLPPDRERHESRYPTKWVRKAIHLIRHPLNNLVSRFQYDRKGKRDDKDWLEAYPNNPDGFLRWCSYQDKYNSKRMEWERQSEKVSKQLRLTPCHSEIAKYIHWHNLAFESLEQLNIPSLLIRYEDYETDFNETLQSVLDFLELPRRSEPEPFVPRKSYSDYFTVQEKEHVLASAQMLASDATKKAIIEHYFDLSGSS